MQAVTGPDAPPNDATVGTTVLVNGEYSPHFDVVTHRYRLRILNSSNFQCLRLPALRRPLVHPARLG